jgi:uncharacterized membrane protein
MKKQEVTSESFAIGIAYAVMGLVVVIIIAALLWVLSRIVRTF